MLAIRQFVVVSSCVMLANQQFVVVSSRDAPKSIVLSICCSCNADDTDDELADEWENVDDDDTSAEVRML
jgi:hypothetical protein